MSRRTWLIATLAVAVLTVGFTPRASTRGFPNGIGRRVANYVFRNAFQPVRGR